MEALLDNDLLSKITRYELLSDFEALLVSRGHPIPFGRLGSALYALGATAQRFKAAKWPFQSQAISLCEFVESKTVGVDGTSTASLSALNVPDLDIGEIQLIAYALDAPQSILYTGDKKAIQVIANTTALRSVSQTLQGRIVCLEQVMHDLADKLGWPHVSQHVSRAAVDTTLTQCFRAPTEEIMKVNVEDNIRQLRTRSGGLLAL